MEGEVTMKICVNCGNKLNGTEKKCPVCKNKTKDAIPVDENDPQRMAEVIESVKIKNAGSGTEKKKGRGCLFTGLAIFVIALVIIIASLGSSDDIADSDKLTLEKYNQIENGMTYEEVVEIIGFEGTPEAEVGEKGSAYYTVSYRYIGDDQVNGDLGANASFMFQGGKLNMKSQLGLK